MFAVLAILFAVVGYVSATGLSAGALSRYNVTDVTISGISSGGYMAVQLHVTYSSIINGSAIFAGGPWYCAEDNIMNAEYKCMSTMLGEPQTSRLISLTNTAALEGTIDPVSNMKNDRIYLFSGSEDTVVDTKVVEALQTYYKYYVNPANIVADYSVRAQHCQPTLSYGENCATLSSPYIGKCDFDGAGVGLATLSPSPLAARGEAKAENLKSFSQTGYFSGDYTSIGDVGYIYVPDACKDGSTPCSLHLAFHGCHQDLVSIGNEYAVNAGYNEWAESNNIIVLYPYAKKSLSLPSNPNGCWDWWGYTNKNYANNKGVQMQFVRSMIKDLTGF